MFQTVKEFKQAIEDTTNKIEWFTLDKTSFYLRDQLMFGWISPQYKDGKLVKMYQYIPWFGCRGFLNEAYFAAISGKGLKRGDITYTKAAHLHKHPMLLFLNEKMPENRMKAAISLINKLEEAAGWENSTYFKVRPEGSSVDKLVFVGSKRWSTAPFYISLITFLLRCAAVIRYGYDLNETPEAYFKRLSANLSKETDRQTWTQVLQVNEKAIEWVMLYQDRILGGNHFEYYRDKTKIYPQYRMHHAGIRFLIVYSYTLRNALMAEGTNVKQSRAAIDKMSKLAADYDCVSINQRFLWNFSEILAEKTALNKTYVTP